jgi:GT2 family glycosyltransferase
VTGPHHDSGDLSVIIPTRERWDKLLVTLDALRAQTVRGFEVIVVVDGLDQCVPGLDGVRLVQQPKAGPGAARNRGVAQSSRRLVLFLGDDMVPSPELVACHLSHHHDNPQEHVAVLGRVAWHPAVSPDRLHRWLTWSGALFDFPAAHDGAVADAGWQRFYSCNVSMKRAFFEASGGFDPDFVFDYEDLDLAWRLGQRGLRLVYEPAAVAYHLHAYDWNRIVARYQSRAQAERLMTSKHEWFRPWFHDQVVAARNAPPAAAGWTLLADAVPSWASPLQSRVRRRADRHYLQRIAPAFLAAWNATPNTGEHEGGAPARSGAGRSRRDAG